MKFTDGGCPESIGLNSGENISDNVHIIDMENGGGKLGNVAELTDLSR